MSKNYSTAEETLGYQTVTDPTNTDRRLLIAGSQNVLIDHQKKVKIRSGYTRLGAANTSLTQVRGAWDWETSTGFKANIKFYNDELNLYLQTIDGVEVDAWTQIVDSLSTTEKIRATTWFDATENIDLFLFVQGDANIYEFSGGVATIASATANTITKNGTTTWEQNRFYATRNKIVTIDGTDYTYTGGESTTTLTGVTPNPSAEAADSIAIQKVVTNSNQPAASHNNHTIWNHENQIAIGNEDDEEVYMSKNDDFTDYTFSSPRVPGEGALLTLTDSTRGFASLGSLLLIFSGNSTIFKTEFDQLDVGSTLTETLKVKKLDVGVDQGALCQEGILPIGNSIAYLTNEVALRTIDNPDNLTGISPKTLSNPIKPDFDDEDWFNGTVPDVFMKWYKNSIYITAPQNSHLYRLNYIQDADGKLKRYWDAPQILPVSPMSIIDSGTGNNLSNGFKLHGHSNAVPETYLLFDGASDGQYAGMAVKDKLPINAKAVFAYDNYKKKGILKTFDEYFVDGEITPNTTDLKLTLNYEYGGTTQALELTIDGSDETILKGNVGINSLAQQSLAVNPLGGLLNAPDDARKFNWIKEIAREDFLEMNVMFSTNEVDRYWAITTHGANAEISRRRTTNIRK